uniref:Apple domain-containing protein n=1 Tax=Panagrellus redivivus TaxID=6233 RepID=A0A7E4W2A4_PANRE
MSLNPPMKTLIEIFWYGTLCYANTGFIYLLAHGLLADITSTCSTSDPTDCVNECAATDGCLAIQMVWGSGTCKLMNMIRAYTWEAEQCGFYIRNETDVTITGRSLGAMNQVLQNVVYPSMEECPDGWTVG